MKIGLLVNKKRTAIDDELKRMLKTLDNMQQVLQPAASELTRRVRARFNNKIDPDGKKWAPWKESTREQYAGQKRTLMLHTKQLRDKTAVVATKRGLRMRMGTWYGKFHEQTNGPVKNLVRRGFFFSAKNRRRLSEKDERFVLNFVSKAVFGKRFTKKIVR